MEAQNAFFRDANVLPRDVAQEHRARGQTYSRNPYVRMLQRDLLPLLLIEKKESAAIVGDLDCLRACRGGDQRKQSGQKETPSSHSGLALIPAPKTRHAHSSGGRVFNRPRVAYNKLWK